MTLDSPQQRRRRGLSRKQLFTAAQGSIEVQRVFLLKQQVIFYLGVLLGLGVMWVLALSDSAPLDRAAFSLLSLGAALALWVLSSIMRLRNRPVQVIAFFVGFLALGASAGSLLGPRSLNHLLNPTLVLGITLLGTILNTLLFKKPRTPFTRYLLVGPWFVIACVAAYLFPAGEWVLTLSGLVAAIFSFLLQFAADETLQIYQPREYLTAAADVVPIFFVSAWQGWTGQS